MNIFRRNSALNLTGGGLALEGLQALDETTLLGYLPILVTSPRPPTHASKLVR